MKGAQDFPVIGAIAFAVQSSQATGADLAALAHLRGLARAHSHHYRGFRFGHLHVGVVSRNPIPPSSGQGMELDLGQISEARDRRLQVRISSSSISVITDWAGSIPCFFANHPDGIVLSNIEPCVVLGSHTSWSDLSESGLYGFLRLSHLLWDETVWKHIRQVTPDSEAIFDLSGRAPTIRRLKSVQATDVRHGLGRSALASELKQLNASLVGSSLGSEKEIILPLSSGYDSRMILAGALEAALPRELLRLKTYGPVGSIEVQAAERLAKIYNLDWEHVELDCEFLSNSYLTEIHGIFGSSLHMHGMYQLEFTREIFAGGINRRDALFTSGFMTGVPAGQHGTRSLLEFGQSQLWTPESLRQFDFFGDIEVLEKELRAKIEALEDLFEGTLLQKRVMVDVWTRQRNFISYYPRTIEWMSPIASPHMDPRYANFFMSLSAEHLFERRLVEDMFSLHYPGMARVPSNSNGFRTAPPLWRALFMRLRTVAKGRWASWIPRRLKDVPIRFDYHALRLAGPDAISPLLASDWATKSRLKSFGGQDLYHRLFEAARAGDSRSYERCVAVQALMFYNLEQPAV